MYIVCIVCPEGNHLLVPFPITARESTADAPGEAHRCFPLHVPPNVFCQVSQAFTKESDARIFCVAALVRWPSRSVLRV